MRTLIFQHTTAEGPGSLAHWLDDQKYSYHIHHVYQHATLPDPQSFDWLVILGGPMNVDEEEKYPFLRQEKEFLRAWLEKRKPVLGICLGGQMLAQCLGGKVMKNRHREIGFHSVSRAGMDHPALRRWPTNFSVFQWHEDRFSLPEGCHTLLTNDACEHQAFALDRRTVGLQFHPESVEGWILENYQDFVPCEKECFVQTKAQCMQLMPLHLPAMTKQFYLFLEDFVAGAS